MYMRIQRFYTARGLRGHGFEVTSDASPGPVLVGANRWTLRTGVIMSVPCLHQGNRL
jgi:hypothetical protein